MRVSRKTIERRGRNQVVNSSRYFVPSVVETTALFVASHENERLVGDDKRRRSQQQEARKSCSGFRVEKMVQSRVQLVFHRSLFLPLPPSFPPFPSRIVSYIHISYIQERDARASARWRQTYRSPRDGTPLTAWPSSRSNASSFRFHFRSTLCAASSSFFFSSSASRRRESLREKIGIFFIYHIDT